MAIRDEIIGIRDKSLRQLDAAHDYFTYTAAVWGAMRDAILRDGLKITFRNQATGSAIHHDEIAGRARGYVREELASATLQQFVSIFENFLSDVMRAWLLAYPQALSSRQLSGKDILPLPDKDAIVDALIEKELRDVFYDRPAKWFGDLKDRTKIGVPAAADALVFAEIKATRDVLVHGQGVANAYYVDKAGAAARVSLGVMLDVPQSYHQASWELIRRIVREIADEIAAKV